MIIALFAMAPGPAVVLRLGVCAPVFVWLYRRSPTRLVFNVALLLFESAMCAALFTRLTHADPLSPRAWLMALLAVQASGLLAGLIVSMAIALKGDDQQIPEVVEGLVLGAAISAVTGVLGLIAVIVLASTAQGRWLLLAATALGVLAHRGYARLLERKAALESVHTFTRALDANHDSDALIRVVLAEVPRLVNSASGELLLLDGSAAGSARAVTLVDDRVVFRPVESLEAPIRQVLATGEALVSGRHSRRTPRSIIAADGATELMVAPLPPEAGPAGALLVRGRLGQVRGFKHGDLLLFETLTSHAGVALGRARLVDRLRHDIGHDRLTGLLNRPGFADALADVEGSRAVLAVHLKSVSEVSEALGHAAGDSLIETAAQRVTAAVPQGSLIGRVDNDVLAVLLPAASEARARETADRILARLEAPVELRGAPIACSAVIGIALSEDRCDLLRRAEIALRATTTRRPVGRYEVGMEPPSARRLAVAAELRRVLADPAQARQIVPFYQPKSALDSGRICGVEALVRWQHPSRGLIPPVDFVPVVESTDLVRPLTLHMLNQALADLARWSSQERALTVAVNLSARSLHDRALIDDVSALLGKHGVDPKLLTLEITESAVMEDPARGAGRARRPQRVGSVTVGRRFRDRLLVAVLPRPLPVDEVKVDRSFVRRITDR